MPRRHGRFRIVAGKSFEQDLRHGQPGDDTQEQCPLERSILRKPDVLDGSLERRDRARVVNCCGLTQRIRTQPRDIPGENGQSSGHNHVPRIGKMVGADSHCDNDSRNAQCHLQRLRTTWNGTNANRTLRNSVSRSSVVDLKTSFQIRAVRSPNLFQVIELHGVPPFGPDAGAGPCDAACS